MRTRYNESFKIQAVEKALNKDQKTSLQEVSDSLGIGYSTLNKWLVKARNQEFEKTPADEINRMTQDKRAQDWTLEERLNMVVACEALDGESQSEYCREQGIYPHHVKQWKLDFMQGKTSNEKVVSSSQMKTLKQENKRLKKELTRKEKALAEAAALLVLQKKVDAIWSNEEDD